MLNGLDLFSGIGGITLGLSPWVYPVAYCESEPFPQSVLLSRQTEGLLPSAPIWDDIRTLGGEWWPDGLINIIYGGWPCQNTIIEPDDHGIIGLWELGAPHSRERWFALAHAEGLRLERLEQQQKGEQNVWKGGQRS